MSTVLVTGGAGFIGSNLVRVLLTRVDARVVVVDKITYAGNLRTLDDVIDHPRLVFVRADIVDRDALARLHAEYRPIWIVNLAAETHVDRSIDNPRAFIDTNVVGTFELLEAARVYSATLNTADRDRLRFLHVSTDEVYGSLGSSGRFAETSPYTPNSPYAASKAGADHLVRAYYETYNLPTIVTNCSNNYGPYQFPEKLIPLMILNAVEGKHLPIYGDGGNVRDWLYVEDHCDGILLALQRGRAGSKYNFGGDSERTNTEVVDRICAVLDELLPTAQNRVLAEKNVTQYATLKRFVTDRPGHDRRYAMDATVARRELGWRPQHDFEAGIRATVRWYLDHRHWCEAVEAGQDTRKRLGLALGDVA